MPIYRSQIGKAHLIEHIAADQRVFHPGFRPMNHPINGFAPGNGVGHRVEYPFAVKIRGL